MLCQFRSRSHTGTEPERQVDDSSPATILIESYRSPGKTLHTGKVIEMESQQTQFEHQWQQKLLESTRAAAGSAAFENAAEAAGDVMEKGAVAWTAACVRELESLCGEETTREIMAGCACKYPVELLKDVREHFEQTRSVLDAHGMLRERFEAFLKHTLKLDSVLARSILERGWGLAGRYVDEQTVVATKIPKSAFIAEYFATEDPLERRRLYCHCPRIRQAIASEEGDSIPKVYCYCGAGFYKGIWEEITQAPVEIEVLESVLEGGEVCTIRVSLGCQGDTS
jgi:hypothetical protein